MLVELTPRTVQGKRFMEALSRSSHRLGGQLSVALPGGRWDLTRSHCHLLVFIRRDARNRAYTVGKFYNSSWPKFQRGLLSTVVYLMSTLPSGI